MAAKKKSDTEVEEIEDDDKPKRKKKAEPVKAQDESELSAEERLIKRQERLGLAVAPIQKEFGKGALCGMADHSLDIQRISTGILELDLAIGGGIPRARMTEIFGPAESRKTTTCAAAVAKAQRLCMNCNKRGKIELKGKIQIKLPDGRTREVDNHVMTDCPCGNPRQGFAHWTDIEGSFDPAWFDAQGVWPEHCMLSRPVVLEEGIDIVQSLMDSSEVDIFVWDSVAQSITTEEMEKSSSEVTVGAAPRKWNTAVKKWCSTQNQQYRKAFDANDQKAMGKIPTLLMINQIRQKIGIMFGDTESTPGGMGIPFFASLRIRLSSAGTKGENGTQEKDNTKAQVFHDFNFRIKKSRTSPSRQGGTFRMCQVETELYVPGEIVQEKALIDRATDCELVTGQQNNYRIEGVFEPGTKELKRFRGQSEMQLYVSEHPKDFQRLYEEIVFKMTGARIG